jgi:hypothetical protein
MLRKKALRGAMVIVCLYALRPSTYSPSSQRRQCAQNVTKDVHKVSNSWGLTHPGGKQRRMWTVYRTASPMLCLLGEWRINCAPMGIS